MLNSVNSCPKDAKLYEFVVVLLGSFIGKKLGILPKDTMWVLAGAVVSGVLLVAFGALIRCMKPVRRLMPFIENPSPPLPFPERGNGFELLDVGVTDQGNLKNPSQLDDVMGCLNGAGADAVVMVYVHGWQHGAASADRKRFRKLLERLAGGSGGLPGMLEPGRRLIGIYLSWTGKTFQGPLKFLSFWDRQATLSRVAQGAVQEVFERLRAWRYQCSETESASEYGATAVPGRRLVIIGHSFGGAIAFRALAQSLFGVIADGAALRPPADCILLINPALSASVYLPLHNASRRAANRPVSRVPAYPFRFLAVTAENDWEVGIMFPLSQLRRLYSERIHSRDESKALLRGLGFMPLFVTGRLHIQSGRVVVEQLPSESNASALFQVLKATPDVINGHGGVDEPAFIDWVYRTVAELT